MLRLHLFMKRRAAAVVCCCMLALAHAPGRAASQPAQGSGIARLLLRLQQVMQAGKPEAYMDLLGAYADRDFAANASRLLISPNITRAVIRERDRVPLEGTLPGDGFRLMAELFIEYGDRARIATWRFDVRRASSEPGDETWVLVGQEQLTVIDGLYRLSLNTARQYRARDLKVHSEDLEVRMSDGRIFVSDTQEGPTAVVLLPGAGATFTFRPSPETEREQVKLFSGADSIESDFEAVFFRVNPGDFTDLFPPSALQLEAVDGGALRQAETVFREEVGKSFSLDLGDLSRENWSLAPAGGDVLVELRTRRFKTITYVKSSTEAEDITVFDRRRRRNISVYASTENAKRYGRFFDEDVSTSYDITDYLVEASIDPERQTIEGRTRLRLRVREAAVNNLTLKLADSLDVRSVYSAEFGRLLFLRVRNQNSLVVNLPGAATRGADLSLTVEYGGHLVPAQVDREVMLGPQQQQDPFMYDALGIPGERSLLYTTRSFWYPQAPVSDYAPAVLRLTVPEGWGVLASGELAAGSPVVVPAQPGERIGGRQFVFAATQPLRYLSCLVSRLALVDSRMVDLREILAPPGASASGETTRPHRAGVFYDALNLTVQTNPRLRGRGRQMAGTTEAVVRFYAGLVGDSPYPSLTVGLIEKDLPGGHSPAYLNVVHQPMPQTTFTWSNDPAAFPNYPEFFVAHEVAHQWWGQAVGWRSYHEQWISEGFAQYFAALYARQSRGEAAFQDVMRRMARFGKEQSAQGPISLGYRLGHIRGDSRVFRAILYNKAAVVLHSLRLLLGDDAFLRGMRRFYFDWRFKKASTADVQRAFERESGENLKVFFDGWIHSSGVPVVRFSWQRDDQASGPAALVRFEQVGALFDVPVPVTLRYADRPSQEVVVPVRGRTAELRIPLAGNLQGIDVNAEGTVIVDVYRN